MLFFKIVLFRIISIVRFLTVQCTLGRLINRDDDAKRSPLSAKHVAGYVYVTLGRWTIDDRSVSSVNRATEEVIAF